MSKSDVGKKAEEVVASGGESHRIVYELTFRPRLGRIDA